MAITDNTAKWQVKKLTNFTDKEREIATQAQAEEGVDNTKVMTPLRVKNAIDKQRPLKTFTSLEQIGCNNESELLDIYNKMPNPSVMFIPSNDAYPWGVGLQGGYIFENTAVRLKIRFFSTSTTTLEEQHRIFTSWSDSGWKQLATTDEVAHLLQNNTNAQTIVGYKNSIYRGKYLGSSLTSAQSATIRAGVFDDLFIGDYWTIGGVNYRIAAFDYYYNCGDTACTTHHIVVVPDTTLYNAQMNTENVTTGAYVGSAMYTTNLAQAKTTIGNAFGTDHLLTIRQYFSNAVTDGYESGGAWTGANVWLMNEHNVYGSPIFNNCTQGTSWANRYTIDNTQYPLFAMNPRMIHTRQTYWLRDVADSTYFAYVSSYGNCNGSYSSNSYGVRPAFLVY